MGRHTKAVEIITFLVRRGYRVGYDRRLGDVKISPTPPPELVERIVANEQILVDLLYSLDGEPATAHPFVAPFWSKREQFRDYGVCIACGIPWLSHGEPAIEHWKTVENVNAVKTIIAFPLPVECECGVAVS